MESLFVCERRNQAVRMVELIGAMYKMFTVNLMPI